MDASRSSYRSGLAAADKTSAAQTLIADPDPYQVLTPYLLGQRALPVEKAEETVLSWLVLLEDGLDPAKAALCLTALPESVPTKGGARLRLLLGQISEHSADRRTKGRRRRSRADA